MRNRRVPIFICACVVIWLLATYSKKQKQNGDSDIRDNNDNRRSVDDNKVKYRPENEEVKVCDQSKLSTVREHLDTWEKPWQMLSVDTSEGEDVGLVYLYSAHCIETQIAGQKVNQVKIIAFGPDPSKFEVFCQIWYDGLFNSVPASVSAQRLMGKAVRFLRKIEAETEEDVKIESYVFTCNTPSIGGNVKPKQVSLVSGFQCNQAETLLDLSTRMESDVQIKHPFGVCMPALRHDLDPVHLREWMEVHRELGVSEFTVYNKDLEWAALGELKKLETTGVVNLKPMPPPEEAQGRRALSILESISINDCILSNIGRYDMIIIADIRNIIVPRQTGVYKTMMEKIKTEAGSSRPDWYSFKEISFPLDCRENLPGHSILFRYLRWKEPSVIYKKNHPIIIDPKKCIAIGPTGCIGSNGEVLGEKFPVSSDIATNNHYVVKGASCQDDIANNSDGELDERLLDYKKAINHRHVQEDKDD